MLFYLFGVLSVKHRRGARGGLSSWPLEQSIGEICERTAYVPGSGSRSMFSY